jgi:CBS domain containing-hemolysin-like protein
MGLLLLWMLLVVVLVHLCSLLETTLFSIRTSALLERKSNGSAGAARLLEIKRNRIDDAIGAILILNTLVGTLGASLTGAQAAALFGDASVGLVSGALTLSVLVMSEIIPKTLAARYAGRLSGFTGHALSCLMWILAPALVVTSALIRLLARRPSERLSRREFTMLVGSAHGEGTISLAESSLIGSLIYSRDVTLKDIMTPKSAAFMMNDEQTVGHLLSIAGADAFSRIPLFHDSPERVVGYISHRQVLKAFATDHDAARKLGSFLRPIPALSETTRVGEAIERILYRHEAIALVTGRRAEPVGLVTLEDLFETILGMEITDEADAIAKLRPAVSDMRKRRLDRLRRKRVEASGSSD